MKRRIACRFCGEVYEGDPGGRSYWTHLHPAECPHVDDRASSLNGVHVGDLWQNLHTRKIARVVEIRIGGYGTYIGHEPVVVLADVCRPEPERDDPQLELFGPAPGPTLAELERAPVFGWLSPHPLWGLVEHWEPLTRPGEYPVPWKPNPRFGGNSRSALPEWRGAGYRHPDEPERDGEHAYWHARHRIRGYSSEGWDWWVVDPDATAPDDVQLALTA